MARHPKGSNLIPGDGGWSGCACWHFGSFLDPYLNRSILLLGRGGQYTNFESEVDSCGGYITVDLEYVAMPPLAKEFPQYEYSPLEPQRKQHR